MKRTVLILLVLWGTASLFAQAPRNNEAELTPTRFEQRQILDHPTSVVANPALKMASKTSSKIGISSSGNVYTSLVEETTCLTANQELGAMLFTARGNPAEGLGISSGSIHVSYSINSGFSWKNIMVTDDGKLNRYPGGVIYNPTGNTDIQNAYAVVCGPTTDGGGWTENFWASVKLDSSAHHVIYENYSVHAQDFPRYGMSAPGSGKIHVLGDRYDWLSGTGIVTWGPITINNGTFNPTTNQFDWNRVLVHVPIARPSTSLRYEVSNYSMAWSPDGSVGYFWVIGIDSANPNTSYQPIVFKSTDFGTSWNKLPFYDFSTNATLYDNIRGTLSDPNVRRPYFTGQMEGAVDNNGELHLFGVVKGAYSTDPDSLGYTFVYEPQPPYYGNLFHVYTSPTGWQADFVSTIYTLTVAADESGFGSGADALGWDHRVQMSRTADGTKIFGVWTDSDTLFFDNVLAPNINVWGKDLTNNTTYPVTDFTTGTANDGVIYFSYVSDIALENANGDVIIPVAFIEKGTTPLNPVYHFFLPGIGFGPTIGIQPVKKDSPLSLIGTYPNPVTDLANIRINLGDAANVNVEIYSITGQLVHQAGYGVLPAGEHHLHASVQHLNSGMYICVVSAGQHKVSGKILRR